MKTYREFENQEKMYKELTFWSNCCGDLHHNGEYDVEEGQLPKELQRAYHELREEGNGCLEYLLEYHGKYYVALSAEFDDDYADMLCFSMDKLYAVGKCNALKLYRTDLFKDTLLLMAKKSPDGDCHEFIFLVPAMESKEVYDEIEKEISERIWDVPEYYTWDDLYAIADGTVFGSAELKAKDEARSQVRELAKSFGTPDLDEEECPEDAVSSYCKALHIRFDMKGNITGITLPAFIWKLDEIIPEKILTEENLKKGMWIESRMSDDKMYLVNSPTKSRLRAIDLIQPGISEYGDGERLFWVSGSVFDQNGPVMDFIHAGSEEEARGFFKEKHFDAIQKKMAIWDVPKEVVDERRE